MGQNRGVLMCGIPKCLTCFTSSQPAESRDLILQRHFAEDAPPTLAQLGLRVRGLAVAQDSADAQLQQQSVEVDDHDALYHTDLQSSADCLNASSAGSRDAVPGRSVKYRVGQQPGLFANSLRPSPTV